jgi:hypothetical protein
VAAAVAGKPSPRPNQHQHKGRRITRRPFFHFGDFVSIYPGAREAGHYWLPATKPPDRVPPDTTAREAGERTGFYGMPRSHRFAGEQDSITRFPAVAPLATIDPPALRV